ncbi:DUF3649 domain-containing protein [Pelagibius sp. 7325]|uniref:DUF3649 domain-containing protein n=1 Tax=Pelagibius sp. 7325 TaxID=3131994 RepID=UPI0030EB5CAE
MTAKTEGAAMALRIAVGIVGGYALACAVAIWISYVLPLARADAVLTGQLISFIVYAGAVLWVFAVRSALRATVGISLAILAFSALAWLCAPAISA